MSSKKKKPFLFALIYGTLLAGYTAYVMLDTFVIPTAEDTSAGEINYSLFESIEPEPLAPVSGSITEKSDSSEYEPSKDSGESTSERTGKVSSKPGRSKRSRAQPSQDVISSDSRNDSIAAADRTSQLSESWSDDNIIITLKEYRENDTAIYAADVRLSSAQYFKTAFASDTFGKNVTAPTSETAAEKNAILAVNGDYYGARENGLVIRNGVLYREAASADTESLCIYADGHFEIVSGGEKTGEELINAGVWQAFTFGPGLIENGEITVDEDDEVGRAMASNPRTAIGIIDELHYIFVVSDGRTSESEGLSLSELAAFMKCLGVQTAYNLDGGGSSTMYYQGEVINNPTTTGRSTKERSVSDIVYIGY